MKRNKMRLGALGAAAALTAMSIAPAMGAEVVAQADASAITIGIAGEETDSGRVTATNDGSGEVKEGQVNPPISVLQGQDLLNLGVLAQDATATVQGDAGISAACAGVAGDGGAVAQVGDSDCITPGQPIGLDLANLDLTGTTVVDGGEALAPFSDQILQPVFDEVVAVASAELAAALAPLGSTGLNGTLGAVQARCAATPGEAEGDATLVDSELSLTIGDQELALATIPANPDPNTKVVTDLDAVLTQFNEGAQQTLRDSLEGSLATISDPLTAELQAQVIDAIVAELADGLQPVEDNFLDITLNQQSSDGPGHIEVTALDLQLLPAAEEEFGATPLSLQIANVNCGPNSTLAPAATPGEEPGDDQPTPEELPAIPTVVDSGTSGGTGNPALAAGLLMLTGAAALLGYRRLLPAGK